MATEILTIGIPTLAVLIGILINNSRLSDLRGYMDARFNAVDRRFTDLAAVLRRSYFGSTRCWMRA